jgi:hypothetical protein
LGELPFNRTFLPSGIVGLINESDRPECSLVVAIKSLYVAPAIGAATRMAWAHVRKSAVNRENREAHLLSVELV